MLATGGSSPPLDPASLSLFRGTETKLQTPQAHRGSSQVVREVLGVRADHHIPKMAGFPVIDADSKSATDTTIAEDSPSTSEDLEGEQGSVVSVIG